MDYKPGDLFIGIIDFFGILVPGAVLLLLQGQWLEKALHVQFDPNEAWQWAVFLLIAYVAGHFLLGLGVPANRLLRLVFPERKDSHYREVKDQITPPHQAANRADAFYRAYALVRLKSAAGLAEIERQMADYKLFRSLMLVFLVDFVVCSLFGCAGMPARSIFSGVLCLLAAWRFLFLLKWTYRITFEYFALLQSDSDPVPFAARSDG